MNAGADGAAGKGPRLARFAMAVAWPSFLMAGVLEALVFAVVDPSDLSWFGSERFELSRQAIYTLSFLLFWGLLGLSTSLSVLLLTLPEPPERPHPRGWPR